MIIKGQIGIYIHWPFCRAKCPYCDFNSHVREEIDEDQWLKAYESAIEYYAHLMPHNEVTSIFFGGGTPSLMNPKTVQGILDKIGSFWTIDYNAEITLEANPTSAELEKFQDFKSAGINRVSIGVQSLRDKDLKFLGREHSAQEAVKTIDMAKKTFSRYSFDLMYARPEQKLTEWESELKEALAHVDDHMSLYQLTIERRTPFYMSNAAGEFSMPDENLSADFYNLTQDIMEKHGLPAYEISNHAKKGHESRHNMRYWTYQDYIGIGPGAHGRLSLGGSKWATREHAAPDIWLEQVRDRGTAIHPMEEIAPKDRMLEALMMGLRLREGIKLMSLEEQGELEFSALIDEEKLKKAQEEGWIKFKKNWLQPSKERLVATREGWLRLNALIPYILKDDEKDQSSEGSHSAEESSSVESSTKAS